MPGVPTPVQELDVWYTAGYAQDEFRLRSNLSLTAGVRFDVSKFTNEGFANSDADRLTFRDETGAPVRYQTGQMPDTKVLWSPRVGFNWDVASDQKTQVRGGTGVFSGKPAYVWISNQLGSTGVLLGGTVPDTNPGTRFPFNPNADTYKPPSSSIVAGSHAALYSPNVVDTGFKFPQVWRNNLAVDFRLPGGIISTTEYIYAKDINGMYYINANLPAAQSAFTGVDNRPRWVGAACVNAGNPGGCATRINSEPGNVVGANYVLKNGNEGTSWNIAQSFSKTSRVGLSIRGAYSYGVSHSLSDPESTAATSFSRNTHSADPNNPGSSVSMWSPGHRVFALVNYSHSYFGFGATSVSAFWEARQSTTSSSSRLSYVFAGDMNGDSISANDLIYIPRDTSEMNFSAFTAGTRTFTAAEQAEAFEAYIRQDPVPQQEPGSVRGAQRAGDADVPQPRPVDQPGSVHQRRRPAERLPDPPRHPEPRQPAEQQLGRGAAPGGDVEHQPAAADSDQSRRGRAGPLDVSAADGEQRADQADLPVVGNDQRRVSVHAQPALLVQLGRYVARRASSPACDTRAGPPQGARPFSAHGRSSVV